MSERKYQRIFERAVPWRDLNLALIRLICGEAPLIAANREKHPRSRPLVYCDKINWKALDLTLFTSVKLPENLDHLTACAALVYAPDYARALQIVLLIDPQTRRFQILACVDSQVAPERIVE